MNSVLTKPATLLFGEKASMNEIMIGASRALEPVGLGSVWKWLIAGAVTVGIAPIAVQAQDSTPPIAAATLFGLPAKNGRVQWPLGLRLLAPGDETKALHEQLELALYFVATQAADGKVNHVFIDFGLRAVRDLRRRLKLRQLSMADATYAEAVRFLDRAERGLNEIKLIETSPNGASP
jgi:hypothetical protein